MSDYSCNTLSLRVQRNMDLRLSFERGFRMQPDNPDFSRSCA